MGVIHEETAYDTRATIIVDECSEDAMRDEDKNITLEVDHFEMWSPAELISFGAWLINQAKRIEYQYDKNGKPIKQES